MPTDKPLISEEELTELLASRLAGNRPGVRSYYAITPEHRSDARAQARLMLAAGEMREALKQCMEESPCPCCHAHLHRGHYPDCKAQAAIKLAEGGK